MNFLIAQLYATYKRSETVDPEFRVRIYLLALTYTALISIVIPGFETLNLLFYDNRLKINPILVVILSVVFFILIGLGFKRYFTEERMTAIQMKYNTKLWPSVVVYTIMVLLYLFLLVLGPTLAILLTGGKMLGVRIHGILE